MIKAIVKGVVALIVFSMLSASAYALELRGKAYLTFHDAYAKAKSARAFAASPGGAYAWRAGRHNVGHAREQALEACTGYLKPGEAACVLVHEQDAWQARQVNQHRLSDTALKSYENVYVAVHKRKAFAIHPNGAWAWQTGVSEEQAIEKTMAACQKNAKTDGGCRLIDVDDHKRGPDSK